ncbi:putative acyl-CoA dehydrogenase 6, partial [Ameca splendens]
MTLGSLLVFLCFDSKESADYNMEMALSSFWQTHLGSFHIFPLKYGGLGLDFSYSIAVAEELGNIHCGGIPMAIGVQSDMATPALARFGSDELKKEFLVPSIMGDKVACLGVSEVGAGSDVS